MVGDVVTDPSRRGHSYSACHLVYGILVRTLIAEMPGVTR